MNVAGRLAGGSASIELVNGVPAFVTHDERGVSVTFVEQRDGLVVGVRSVLNPDKMAGIGEPHLLR